MADKDLASGLIERIKTDFDKAISQDKKVDALNEKRGNGKATYKDAYDYAESVGNARAKALSGNISSDTIPEGKMYYSTAKKVMTDSLTTDHNMITDYAADVQESYNKKAGISLKAQRADVDEDRIDGFAQRIAAEENIDDVAWILQEPVVTHARSVVDDNIKKNAEFQHKAGLKATVKRDAAAKCCDWCAGLDGEYTYPNVPREVFQRHDHCKCTVDYEGKKLRAYESGGKAHTFRDPDEERRESRSTSERSPKERKDWHGYKTKEEYVNRFAKRDIIENQKKTERIKELMEQQKQIEKIENTPFYAFKSLSAAARKFYVDDEKHIKNTDYYIKPGTYVTGVKVISTGDKIREVDRLMAEYKLPNGELTKVKDWYKVRGRADVTDGTKVFSREIHWYQAENIGKVEFKFPSNKKQR